MKKLREGLSRCLGSSQVPAGPETHPVDDAGVEEKLCETPHSMEVLLPPRDL